jgi:hypothetical protein
MLVVVRDAIGGDFDQGASREQISLMKFVEVFQGSKSIILGEAD